VVDGVSLIEGVLNQGGEKKILALEGGYNRRLKKKQELHKFILFTK
jgi:hypothetical protein